MKHFSFRFSGLSAASYDILSGTLRLCCCMLFCSFLLLLHTGGLTVRTYSLFRLAAELQSSSAAVLLAGNVSALLLELLKRSD